MRYLRPLPHPAADGPRLAGGWLRFDRVAVHERGHPVRIRPVTEIAEADLEPFLTPRAPIAGIDFDRPSIMGILNVTPDSFSDGGRFDDTAAAVAQAEAMQAADILDIGGESTRPGAAGVEAETEIARILPVIMALAGRRLSVDTRKASVARAAMDAGAVLVNDVSAMTFDGDMAATVAAADAPICLMHAQGSPETMQADPRYDDVLLDVYDALVARIAAAEAAGVRRNRILIDPGIGFGKTMEHNLTLLRGIGLFHGLGVPILLGASRKGFIGTLGDAPRAADRMGGTLAITLAAVAQGIQMHRVHDVAQVAQGLALWRVTGGYDGALWN
ncbi:dihydropteroate synthase [Jannaschia rubra]|uniref:Dihydropteroate synthase n=1 Tax=Jannaschia rubra TaxID=282197 RepID=A0A0M6XQ59_9RHOB|nr:dihydropteroate synthase [Jannaschia rubra]CTQ32343.1 Dihydropteroate synthase [Jannaschia rubra]SFG46671.1 Dihydropteroate synthase [Jannaschia rubra]